MKVAVEELVTVTMSMKELNTLVETLESELRYSMEYYSLSPLVIHILKSCKTFTVEPDIRSVESYLKGSLAWEAAITSMNPNLVQMYKTFAYHSSLSKDTIEFFKELNDILKDRINELLRNYESEEIAF